MKKLSIMIFMAATMLAACSDGERTQPKAGEPGYISTNGESVETNDVELERTSNTPDATPDATVSEETPMSEGKEEADARARKAMNEEQKRLSYWTVEEESITADAESVRGNLDQMDKNWFRINADLKNVETGTYNPQGQLSREGQKEIKEARAKVEEAKRLVKNAQRNNEAGNHEAASDKIKNANQKLADAREDYLEALEKETGVEREEEVVADQE
ncbi:hypothetical protein D770_11705 [Flammeovirgaceae bacterium 311]|nr:hypothetical protein D770_11705 [Flammeovirgaceae bacterium 311]